jgi:hypothetical protein
LLAASKPFGEDGSVLAPLLSDMSYGSDLSESSDFSPIPSSVSVSIGGNAFPA